MGAHLSTTVAQDRAFMQLIDGKPVDAPSGARIDVLCPSDGEVFASIPSFGAADVDRAVASARLVFSRILAVNPKQRERVAGMVAAAEEAGIPHWSKET